MIKPNNTKCSKAPVLTGEQHTYKYEVTDTWVEGVCIYCGEKEGGPRETIKPTTVQAIPEYATQDHINGLVLSFEMNGMILAAQARIEGMKADNDVRRLQEDSPAYHGEDFEKEASNIESYARYLRVMRKVGVDKFHSKYSEGVIVSGDNKKSVPDS